MLNNNSINYNKNAWADTRTSGLLSTPWVLSSLVNATHVEGDVCTSTNDKKKPYNRNVFYTISFHQEEVDTIKAVTDTLKQEQELFPTWWTDADTLRFVHEFGFNKPLVVEKIKNHFRWLRTVPGADISDKARNIVEYGILYQLGRDKRFRPNIYLVLSKAKDIQENLPLIIEALMHILVLVRRKMMLTFYIEQWNLFVDCSGSNVLSGGSDILNKVYQAIRDNFPQTLHKVLVYNGGLLEGIDAQYNPYNEGTLKDKVVSIQDKKDKTLFNYIDRDQLEQKYGGSYQDLIAFWPPPPTYNKNMVTKQLAEKRHLYFFQMHERSGFGSVLGPQSDFRGTEPGFGQSTSSVVRQSSPVYGMNGAPGRVI